MPSASSSSSSSAAAAAADRRSLPPSVIAAMDLFDVTDQNELDLSTLMFSRHVCYFDRPYSPEEEPFVCRLDPDALLVRASFACVYFRTTRGF
jgi:hypothetical protein